MINIKEIVKFIIAGIVNTLFYYIMFSFFIFINLDYKLAVLYATMIGVFFSFKTFGKFVFKNNSNILIFKFALVYVLLYFLNIGIIALLQEKIANYYISGGIATIICAVISFLLNKFYVFKGKK